MSDQNTSNDFLDFNLPQKAYAGFDALTLKNYIIERLNENEKFTESDRCYTVKWMKTLNLESKNI